MKVNVSLLVTVVKSKLAALALARTGDTGHPIASVVVDMIYDYVAFHLTRDDGT